MADFDTAIAFVLQNEGGLSNNPSDPGGLTNFGISQRQYPNVNIRELTREKAQEIYKEDYWDKFPYDSIVSQRIATKLFDSAVNMGPVSATRLMQLALSAIEVGPVVADGLLGSATVEYINSADEERLLDEFKARLCKHYADLGKPEFILGWMRRAVRG